MKTGMGVRSVCMRLNKMATTTVSDSQVLKALSALQYHEQRKSKRPKLLEEDGVIWAMVALTKIPQGSKRPVRIPLPHSLHGKKYEPDVCLITKDSKKTVKDLLMQHEVTFVKKVIPLEKLRTEFKSFESRRQLCSSFDVFLADSRVYHNLHGILGKSFYARRKFPLSVNMRKKGVKLELEAALGCTHFNLGLGSCISIPVSRLSFTPEQGNDNVQALAKGLSLRLPGGWATVQSIHLKTVDSVALPIHKILPKPPATISVEGYSHKIERKRSHLERDPDVESTAETNSAPDPPPQQKKRIKAGSVAKTKRQACSTSPAVALARIRGSKVRKEISVRATTRLTATT